jgi:transposase
MSNSIFKSASNDLKKLLAICKPEQLLYAPIDVAKYNHSAMIVNLLGEIIIPKFDFPYNLHGIDFLKNKLQSACDISHAKKLFLALESTGHYHENLVASLSASGYDIAVIRPIDSKNERDNVHAKTDTIDLAAIAKVIISNKGTRSNMPDTVYYNLQRASRTHRQLTWQDTRVKNIITMLVDKTFTGLWNPENAIFSDKWGKASLLFVSHYPTPQQAIKIGAKRLSEFFKKHNTKLSIDTADKIIELAKNTPARPLETMESDILALKANISVLETLTSAIQQQKRQMVKYLVQTPGTYLLSIPGISVVYAADFTAEVGDIHRFAYAGQVVSLAGTAPRKYQSGELDKANLPTSHKGKNLLRMTVNQMALSLNTHCPEFHKYYSDKLFYYKDAPPKARTATANRFIKLAYAMMKNETLYCPKTGNPLTTDKDYYQSIWNKVKEKLADYLSDGIPQDNYLSKIQHQLEEKYDITQKL